MDRWLRRGDGRRAGAIGMRHLVSLLQRVADEAEGTAMVARKPIPFPQSLARAFAEAGIPAEEPAPPSPCVQAIELSFAASVPPEASAAWANGRDLILRVPPPPTAFDRLAARVRRWIVPAARVPYVKLVSIQVASGERARVRISDHPNRQEGHPS